MAKWTLTFIGINFLGFLYQAIFATPIYLTFVPFIALDMPWMFVTSMFLHGGIQHIFFNMIALFFFGTYLENTIGGKNFFTLFLMGGIVGNLGYMLTASDPLIPALGASGAVYGIMGALALLRPFLIVFAYGMPLPLIVATFFYALLDFAGLFVPSGIAHGAHLAGLFVGGVAGIYLRMSVRKISW